MLTLRFRFAGHKNTSQMPQSPSFSHIQFPAHAPPTNSQTLRKKEDPKNVALIKNSVPKRSDSSSILDSEVGSTKSGGRRPSVDTVSTYLSHESEMRASTSQVSIEIEQNIF